MHFIQNQATVIVGGVPPPSEAYAAKLATRGVGAPRLHSIARPHRGAWRGIVAASAIIAGQLIPSDCVAAGPGAAAGGRYRLLFDDYYQIDRGAKPFSQGVALQAGDRPLTNHYSPEVNALANGTFVMAQLIADKFQVEVSNQPISATLLRTTDAYMLVGPVKVEFGGRAALTVREAAVLEDFVARGGMLILVLNSFTPSKTRMDWEGMNQVARKFGLEFQKEETGILSVPVAKDDPLFDGIDGIIYGNGTTLRVLPGAEPTTMIMKDPREGSNHAPVGVILPFKKGRVLAFGDGGTFGNAHMFRSDIDHAKAVKQMFYGLLPNGPAPTYGWKEGLKLLVRVKHEQILSGYPYENRLMALPPVVGSEVVLSEARAQDLVSFPDKEAARMKSRFATTILRKEASFHLEIGAFDGRAYAAAWQSGSGESMKCRILPRGRVLDPSSPGVDFVAWQWALGEELICAPLKAYARPGETWEADGMIPLPHAQLHPVPTLIQTPSTFRFDGEATYAGKPCFLFTRTTFIETEKCRIQDFVLPESITQFGPEQIKLLSVGQTAVTKFWVNRESLLPIHTEMRISSGIWWFDSRYPLRFEGSHDWRTFENWREINFVADFGRLLTADFEVE